MAWFAEKVFIFLVGLLVSLCVLLRNVIVILRHPRTALGKKERAPPLILVNPAYGFHEYATLRDDVKIHYVARGNHSKPLMLLLHGFPEFWFSWRHQLKEFAEEYRVVAIDLRGYGDSSKPPHTSDYTMNKLTQDILELIPALGYEKCVLVSHDWGGVIAWNIVSKHSELVNKHIAMNSPHPQLYVQSIRQSPWQLSTLMYISMLQVPWITEWTLSLSDYTIFDQMISNCKDRNNLDVVEAYKYMYSQSRRSFSRPIKHFCSFLADFEVQENSTPSKINTPTLIIWGDMDKYLNSDLADKHTGLCSNIIIKHIPDCSHWVQQDKPVLVNQYIRDFLKQ